MSANRKHSTNSGEIFFVPNGTEMHIAFCVPDGTLELEYFADNWESENTYELMDVALNVVFSDGTFPATGKWYFSKVLQPLSWLNPVCHL